MAVSTSNSSDFTEGSSTCELTSAGHSSVSVSAMLRRVSDTSHYLNIGHQVIQNTDKAPISKRHARQENFGERNKSGGRSSFRKGHSGNPFPNSKSWLALLFGAAAFTQAHNVKLLTAFSGVVSTKVGSVGVILSCLNTSI